MADIKDRTRPVQFEDDENIEDQISARGFKKGVGISLDIGSHAPAAIDQAKRLLGMGDRKVIQAPGLSEQEQVIIARMKELALGDPELGKLYTDFTFRALEGEEGVSLGLKRDIEEQEAITKEALARRLGSTGDVRSTAGVRTIGRFREKANIAKERARQDAIAKGEGLLSSRSRRLVGAAGAALGPLAQQRGLESAAQIQTAANVTGEKAGLLRLGGQLGGLAVTQARSR